MVTTEHPAMENFPGSLSKDHPASKQALSLTLNILHLVGLWPLKKSGIYTMYTLLVSLNYCAFLLMLATSIIAGGKTTTSSLEDIGIFISFIPATFNVAMVLFKREQFEKIITNLKSFYARTLNDYAAKSLHGAAAEEKILFTVISIACVIGIPSKLSQPLLGYYTGHRDANSTVQINLPFQLHPFEDEASILAFTVMYAFQCVVFTFIFLAFMPADLFLSVLILYTAEQFEILSILIRSVDCRKKRELLEIGEGHLHDTRACRRQLDTKNSGEAKRVFVNTELEDEFSTVGNDRKTNSGECEEMANVWRKLATYHQEALRNAMDLREFLRTSLFLVYAVTSLVIGSVFYQLSTVDCVFSLLYNCNYLAAMLSRLFMISFFSTRLASKSVEVSDAIAGTQWYDYGPGVKTTLVIITCRAQRPVKMWAGRFAVMSLETYTAILQAAYSYFGILINIT